MSKPEVRGVRFLFLVGGFAESPMLQKAVHKALGCLCRIIIPHNVGLTILKGAVLFGLDPTVVRTHQLKKTKWHLKQKTFDTKTFKQIYGFLKAC